MRNGIEDDADVRAALCWFAHVSGDTPAFWRRIDEAMKRYRLATDTLPVRFGNNVSLDELGKDQPASYLAQATALLQDRRSYDLNLGSRIVPFIKHLGSGVELLQKLPGATERANRLLRPENGDPGSAIFELAIAVRYAKEGFSVQFIPEDRGGGRRPDLAIQYANFSAEVECKRLQESRYAKEEALFQCEIFRQFSNLVHEQQLNVNVDVVYTRELKDVPVEYLYGWTKKAMNCSLHLSEGFPWKDEYGYGRIKPATVGRVRRDILNSGSILFGPKLARLLTDKTVSEGAYYLAVNFKPDYRDARFMEGIHYGSVATWRCEANQSIKARARHIKSKLNEVDLQLKSSPRGIVHIGMDADGYTDAADLRRTRNIDVVTQFQFDSNMCAGCLHYFVFRISEVSSWMVDETADRFGPGDFPAAWSGRIFDQAQLLDNYLPAWHQQTPAP